MNSHKKFGSFVLTIICGSLLFILSETSLVSLVSDWVELCGEKANRFAFEGCIHDNRIDYQLA